MRRPTIVILVLVGLVLAPMWYVAAQGPAPAEPIEIDEGVSDIRPNDGFLDVPNELSPSQVGVIVWVALFALFGLLAAVHRFMTVVIRRPTDAAASTAGASTRGSADWLVTDDRWIVDFRPPTEAVTGLIVMAFLAALAVAFSALFTWEYLGLARTQYFGSYAAGMFFSLAGLTVAYYAWFLPHVAVAERRDH